MRLPATVIREVVERLLKEEDYRYTIVSLIDAEFLNYTIDFFKKVAEAKIDGAKITSDWYRETMLSGQLPKEQIALHSGLNLKTIGNTRHSQRREIVIEEARQHYEKLRQIIDELIQDDKNFNLEISLTFRGVSVTLDVAESLVVINALAVARATIRGGVWSSVGKQVEKPLMEVLCKLYQVPPECYDQSRVSQTGRETDFFLLDKMGNSYRCEVKLLGKGNPESADAAFARDAQVLIVDTISEMMKNELSNKNILWMELRNPEKWEQFERILSKLKVPHTMPPTPLRESQLNQCLDAVFS